MYESEAALRLVDHELHQLHDIHAVGQAMPESADAAKRARAMGEANAQLMEALVELRERNAAQPVSEAADLLREMERRMTAVSNLLQASGDGGEVSAADSVIFKATN